MPPPTWSRASVSTTTTSTTFTTMTSQKRVNSARRRASTGNRSYREPSNFSDDDSDFMLRSSSPTPAPTPGLKEAREHCQNNLRLAWESIFTRYSQGNHLAAGRDDVFDFGTGEIIEDAGFLDDFIVEDDDVVFEGRSIEIGDFGLPGASGMNDLTDSSSEEGEEETPTRSRQASFKSEDDSEQEDGSGDDLLLASSPSRARRKTASMKQSRTGWNRARMSRSISMPESIDLLSSSDDEMGQRDVHPVSDKYKEIKRIRTSMKEDLLEFQEAEAARQAKEAAERVKRERTCTPFLGSPNVAHLRAQSIRPLPRSAPSSYRPYVSSSLVRQGSSAPAKAARYPTPPTSSSSFTSVKPESSGSSSLDIKPFRASSSRPLGRCFSLKPSSSSSSLTSAPLSSTSAIPLGHYSNTLLNQAVAAEEDSSDDELAMRSPSVHIPRQDERFAYSAQSSVGKGKQRAKDEDQGADNVFFDDTHHTRTHLPSPPSSRLQSSRKRSPTFFSSPTASTLPPLQSGRRRKPVVEVVRSPSQPPPAPRLPKFIANNMVHPHTVPRVPASRLEQYRPKQSSPLKGSSNQHQRPSATKVKRPALHLPRNGVIDISSSDDEDDIPLRSLDVQSTAPIADASKQTVKHEDEETPRAPQKSPSKRKYSTSLDNLESPTHRAKLVLPTPPRSLSSASSSLLLAGSTSPVTPSVPLAKMNLATSKSAPALSNWTRRPKEETPDAFAFLQARKVKREESVLPPTSASTCDAYPSHLPTPPLSSGSATAFPLCKEETPDVKAEEEQDVFKAPLPRRKLNRMPSIPARRWSTPSLAPNAQKPPGKIKEETPAPKLESLGSDDDDEIMLISPSRLTVPRRGIISSPTVKEVGQTKAGTRVRSGSIVHTSPRRAQSIAKSAIKASPTVMRDRPPPSIDGYESDDPLAI